jgi:ankyrin repeat protein
MMNFKSIPPRVFAELTLLAELDKRPINGRMRSEAVLQLAFCYSAGWGTVKNPGVAAEYLNIAAAGGSKNAMEISARFPAALGCNAASGEKISPWLRQCARQGSRVAQKDLAILFPQEAEGIRDEKRKVSRQPLELALTGWLSQFPGRPSSPSSSHQQEFDSNSSGSILLSEMIAGKSSDLTSWLHNDVEIYASYVNIVTTLDEEGNTPLLVAVKAADFELVRLLILQLEETNVSQTDTTGATSLHWLSIFPFSETKDIVDMLLNAGLDPQQATTAKTQVAGEEYFLPEITAGSTALDWAIENDNAELVQYLMRRNRARDTSATVRFEGVLACATRYYSNETIKALCPILDAEAVNEFDSRGFSAFYYSIRQNFFQRILRFVPSAVHDPSQTARSREIETIKMLFEVGSNMQVYSKNYFNCFHVLASVDDVDIFKVVLKGDPQKQLMDSHSNFRGNNSAGTSLGRTPLDVAIKEGNVYIAKLLLDVGADPSKCQWNWESQRPVRHALHVCAYAPWESAVPMAEIIVRKDPSSVHVTWGIDSFTPLHEASWTGQEDLIRFLLKNGSDLIPRSTYYTPLGVAIASRSITGVKVLAQAHHKAKKALVAAVDKSWRFALPDFAYLSAITFLLTPGHSSTLGSKPGDEKSKMGSNIRQIGCLDHPFSETSKIILTILLGCYEKAYFQWNLRSAIWKQDRHYYYSSGLPQVVRLADLDLFEKLIKSGKFKPSYDDLIFIAIRQLIIMNYHIASDDARVEMINKLRHLQLEEYNSKWNARKSISRWPLRCYWHVLFHIWVQPERRMENRLRDCLVRERLDKTGDPWRGRWDVNLFNWSNRFNFPLWLVNSCITWFVFLVPMVVTTAIAAHDPASQWTGTETRKLLGIILMVSQISRTTPAFAAAYTPLQYFRHSQSPTVSG